MTHEALKGLAPEDLANSIRTWGWWQGPDEHLDELVRRLRLAEDALDEIDAIHQHSSGENGWSDAEAMYDTAYDAICQR